jgi:GntR family transcriptional repressor for pyruvate dehydrogenase complex
MKALDRTSLTERILDQLKEYILSDSVAVGDKLPSEKEICRRLNVGRSSVREALVTLQALGYIDVKHGKGAFLTSKSVQGAFRWILDHRVVFEEYMEVRSVLEVFAIKLAVRNITRDEIKGLRKTYERFEEAYAKRDVGKIVSCEEAFHAAIVGSTRNRLLIDIYQKISDAFFPYREKSWRIGTKRSLKSHAGLLAAIIRRDPKEASKRMQLHLRQYSRIIGRL